MDTDKIIQILDSVKELTNQKKLNWESDNSGITYESFRAVISSYKILVYSSAMECVFVLYDNESGKQLGRLSEAYWNTEKFKIAELIEKVKRQVHRIDEGLDDLLNKLKDS